MRGTVVPKRRLNRKRTKRTNVMLRKTTCIMMALALIAVAVAPVFAQEPTLAEEMAGDAEAGGSGCDASDWALRWGTTGFAGLMRAVTPEPPETTSQLI